MINVVDCAIPQLKTKKVLGCLDQVFLHQRTGAVNTLEVELLVDLVTAHTAQVVALGIEEQTLDQGASVGRSRRIAGPQPLVDFLEGILLVVGRILGHAANNQPVVARHVHDLDFLDAQPAHTLDHRLGQRLERACHDDTLHRLHEVTDQNLVIEVIHFHRLRGGDLLNLVKRVQQGCIAAGVLPLEEIDGPQEGGDQEFAAALLPVEIDIQHVVGVKLRLKPGTPVRNDPEGVQHLAVRMPGGLEGNAR